MSDKEMLFYAQAYRALTKATAEISNNSEDQKRFEIIDWLVKQAEKTDRYHNVLHKIAYGPETGSEINGINYRLDHEKWQRLATEALEGTE